MELKRNTGITLVALIVTIIVMLILAGVSINAIVGDNGILIQATKAVSATTYANYLEELQIALVSSGDTPTVVGESLKNYITSISDSDLEKFMILKGELYYIGSNNSEAEAAELVGISTDLSGGSVAEVIFVINNVIILENEEDYIGTELLDKNALNSETWKLAIDYNGSNIEVARYGTGYYLLMPDTEYTINGENVTFTDYYVIDYKNQVLISSNSIVYWDINSTLAVSDGLVLNIDPTNMADINYVETSVTDDAVAGDGVETTAYQLYVDSEDTGITMYGDVVYDEDTSALMFNESEDNPLITEDEDTAGGGYMKLIKDDDTIDFSGGFSFEIYMNLSRIGSFSALFCRLENLFNSSYGAGLRFGGSIGNMCKFCGTNSEWVGSGNNLYTILTGNVKAKDLGYNIGEDVYVTYVYSRYNEDTADEIQMEYYNENAVKLDKVEYYINGKLFGYTYYGANNYETGLNSWNSSDCAFYLGICVWNEVANFYYLKGSVYTCRLYTTSFTEKQVEESYNVTLKYRNSFT